MFRLGPGEYARVNEYWQGHSLIDLIKNCEPAAQERYMARVDALKATYDRMSDIYQRSKDSTDIPLR